MDTNDPAYKAAVKRAKQKAGFYRNLITYVVVNILLMVINLVTNPGDLWFFYVTLFWGLGLAFHAKAVFLTPGESDFEKKLIQKELDKIN